MSIGRAVIRPLKDALDDMPVHVRQLSEMFRKHGQKQNRNTSDVQNLDSPDSVHPLRDGWRENSWWTPDRIVGSGKSNRPYPGEYLDSDYIQQHLDQFGDGATRFYRADSVTRWGPSNADGTTFVFPTSEIDGLIAQADGDPRALGQMLGLGEDFFVDGDGNAVDIVRGDFTYEDITNGNIRMPRGDEAGANPQWIPGGYLPEGVPEAVINVPDLGTGTYTDFYVE